MLVAQWLERFIGGREFDFRLGLKNIFVTKWYLLFFKGSPEENGIIKNVKKVRIFYLNVFIMRNLYILTKIFTDVNIKVVNCRNSINL